MTQPISAVQYPYPEGLRLFNPDVVHPEDRELRAHLRGANLDEPQNITYLPLLSMAIHSGFQKLTYVSHNLPDGRFFAMTADRSEAFGRCICKDMQFLGLELTCFLPGTAQFVEIGIDLAREDGSTAKVHELMFAHKSADEVTVEEAVAFARVIHKLNVRVAHLWAGEFDEGALDAFCVTLNSLGNRSLSLADICDVSKPEPEDRIRHSGIESIVHNNRNAHGRAVSYMGTPD